jgi:excisionase family DNA binding protein
VALVDDQREDDALQVTPAPTLLVSIRSAAQMLEIGQPKVRELLTQGAFSSIKIGSTLRRIPVAQLQAYVARLVAEQCEAGV